jgi:hypothetical protein
VGEAQDVGLAVAQHLQQQSGLAFAGAGALAEGVGQRDQHAVAEPADQLVADGEVDLVEPGVAGQVGLVDQLAQRPGDLRGPDGVWVDLGGVVKIAQKMRTTELVDQPGELARVVVLVAVCDTRSRVLSERAVWRPVMPGA